MKFKSLPNGKIFQITPQPGTRYAAIKADGGAYLLHNTELDIKVKQTENLLTVLRGGLFQDFRQIKLT